MQVALIALAAGVAAAPTSPAAQSVEAAVAVVQSYYSAIQRHDYRAAYALWNGHRTLVAFRRGYAQTAWVKLTPLSPYRVEGAAGSSYATINVRVDAALNNGRRQHFVGRYVLRRVNGVDGAIAAQRRWHITDASLKPIPAGR